jgi:hypothetical protein
MTVVATTLTTLDDSRHEFPTAQLEDELVFKGGRDVMVGLQYRQRSNTAGNRE